MALRRLLLIASLALAAAAPAARAQVAASLVRADASAQPGRPITVALHFVHQPHWHTYWVNPGTGLPTSIAWTLPPGWKAGPIQWPAPKILKDTTDEIIGSGYDGDLLLPVEITPPADAKPDTTAVLMASVRWLMCQDICKPGQASLSLDVPVAAGPSAPDPQWGARLRAVLANLPKDDPAWKVSAWRGAAAAAGKPATIVLDIAPAGGAARKTPGVHFFSLDNLVAYDAPQMAADDGHGGTALTLSLAPDGPASADHLTGVVTCENGWRADGSLPGLQVDVPIASASPAATVSPPLPSGGSRVSGRAAPPPITNGRPPPPTSGGAGILILAFVGGLILNLMPCVFPVLGIKILGFVNQAGHARGRVVAHGLVFSGGVLISFWILAGVLTVLRAGGDQLGWGFQLQSPGFIFALSAVMLVFALNMSGVFEFGLGATAVGGDLQAKSGLAGSFFTGILATLVATPCSAPFLAPALGAALSLSAARSFAIFTVIAMGLSTPYLLLSIFPGAVRILPRPGGWMITFKEFMAFPLYGTVGYLLWVLAGQVQEYGLLSAFIGLVLIAMGAWAYGRWRAPGASRGRATFGLAAGLALIALGAWCGWPVRPSPTAISWDKWSPEEVAHLRSEGRIVYVDFTARWCATCQANKRLVFHSDAVLQAFRKKNIATIEGDWTNQDPQITAELAKYHRSAVPFNLVWLPGKNDPVILPEILTPRIVLDAVNR